MKQFFSDLSNACGLYKGQGLNHENQTFTGEFNLKSLLGGKGFSIRFTARGADGSIFHREESTIAPAMTEKLTLWNFNSNTPALIAHELRSTNLKPNCKACFIFGFNDVNDMNSFREEVALDIWNNGDVSYTYSWAMPGQEFKERSGVRMQLQ